MVSCVVNFVGYCFRDKVWKMMDGFWEIIILNVVLYSIEVIISYGNEL